MSERGEDDVSVFPGGVWRYPTEIRFGVGAIAELPSAVKAAGKEAVATEEEVKAEETAVAAMVVA